MRQNDNDKERALRFDDEAFAEAVRYVWRKRQAEIVGWNCLVVPNEVAEELLEHFNGHVREIVVVDVSDLPPEEAMRVHAERFEQSKPSYASELFAALRKN